MMRIQLLLVDISILLSIGNGILLCGILPTDWAIRLYSYNGQRGAIKKEKKDTTTAQLLHRLALGAIGNIILGFGITLLLERMRNGSEGSGEDGATAASKSIAWGHIPLWAYMFRKLLQGGFRRPGIRTNAPVLLVSILTLGIITILLDFGSNEPMVIAKVLSMVFGSVSLLFYLNCGMMSQLVLGLDVKDDAISKALVRAEHQYLFLAELFNLAIITINGYDYQQALGYVSLAYAMTTMEVTFVRNQQTDLRLRPIPTITYTLFAIVMTAFCLLW